MFPQCADKCLHCLDWIKINHCAAKLVYCINMFWREKLFFLSCAAFWDIDGWVQPPVSKLALEYKLHVASAFEFLKDQFVHSAASIN